MQMSARIKQFTKEPSAVCAESHAAPPRTFTKVLLVDDSKFLADVLAVFFSRDGYEARAAYGGEEAIAAVEEEVPDIAFIDLDMPNLNGLEVATHLRRSKRAKNMVLVALSGLEDADIQSRAQDAGFDHFITKPVDIPALRLFMQEQAGGA